MKRLRTILQLKYLFILVVIISLIRINHPYKSIYNSKYKEVIGTVYKYKKSDSNTKIYLKSHENIIINCYSYIDIKLGDKIRVEGKFSRVKDTKTKELFNYKKYLERRGIYYEVNAKNIYLIKHTTNIIYILKNYIVSKCSNSYMNAFILGDTSSIDLSNYRKLGISHLFAISGMHISFISVILLNILSKFKISNDNSYKIVIIFLLFYLFLTGITPSILRAVIFFILVFFNKKYNLLFSNIELLIITFLISLLINPFYIYEVSFIYSFVISFSLLYFNSYLSSNNYFISVIKTSVISFIFSFPITLYNYNEVNILSVFYNIIYVPVISLYIFPLTIISFFIPFFSGVLNLSIDLLEESIIYFTKIDSTLVFISFPIYIYLIYYCLLFLKKKYWLIILVFFHYIFPIINNNSYFIAFDVGQGDSLLLHYGNKNILIDTGGIRNSNNSIIINQTIPIFKKRGISKISYLIISHGDFDHMGEAINLVNNFKVEKVIFNCGPYNELESELIKVLDKKHIKYYSCIKELDIDKNKLYFLQTKEYDNENDNSNVIYTELNGYRFMLMGDASNTTEHEILNEYNLPVIDVLKVGHHGSKTSSSKEFISDINPKYSIISVGKNNRYGHPNKEALDNLKESKIYRTDQDGSIMFKIKNNKLKIETCSP